MRLKTINTIPHYLSLLILQENCSLQSTNYLYHHKIKKMNTSCPPDSRSRAAARRPVRLRAFRTQTDPALPGDGGAGKFFYISTHVFAGIKDAHPAFEVRVLGAAACRWWRWRESARGLTNSPPDCWSRAVARRPVRLRALRTQTDPAPPGDGEAGSLGGDGGSRTRVRKRVPAAFYERSRALKIPLESHRTAGNLLR